MSITQDDLERQRLVKIWLGLYDPESEFEYVCTWESDVYVTVKQDVDDDMFGATTTTYTDRSFNDGWIKSNTVYSLFNMI